MAVIFQQKDKLYQLAGKKIFFSPSSNHINHASLSPPKPLN